MPLPAKVTLFLPPLLDKAELGKVVLDPLEPPLSPLGKGGRKRYNLTRSLQRNWEPLAFVMREVSLIWRGDPPDDVF